jgi:ligand-binding sensor domain-containing protein
VRNSRAKLRAAYTKVLPIFTAVAAAAAFGQQLTYQAVPGSPPGVTHLFEDTQQRLWVGTTRGAYLFDGARFYSLRGGRDAEMNSQVHQIAEDGDSRGGGGAIWFATMDGLYRYGRGRLTRAVDGVVQSVAALGKDTVLVSVGTHAAGLSQSARLVRIRFKGAASPDAPRAALFEETVLLPQLNAQGWLTEDRRSGDLLFACPPGWCEIRTETARTETSLERVAALVRRHQSPPTSSSHNHVLRDGSKCVWSALEGAAWYQCPGDREAVLIGADILPAGVSSVAELPNGLIALRSIGRLAIGKAHGKFQLADAVNGVPGAFAFYCGKDGTYWIGGASGLGRLTFPWEMEYWTARDGLLPVTSVARLPATGEVFAGAVGGVLRLSPDRRTWSTLAGTESYRRIEGLIADEDGTSLIAGLPYFGAGVFDRNGKVLGLTREKRSSAWHVARTKDGRLWSSGNRLGELKRRRLPAGGLEIEIAPEDLGPQYANANALDIQVSKAPEGEILWACYAGGLMMRRPGVANTGWERLVTVKQGLRQDACRSLAATPDGNVWYGYNTDPGFARIRHAVGDGGRSASVKNFGTGPDVGTALVHFLDVDSRGWLWRGANDGVYVADPEMAESGFWMHLRPEDGLPSPDMNQQSFYDDPDGSVWWGAGNTLMHFRPSKDLLRPQAGTVPGVWVSGISQGTEDPPVLAERAGPQRYGVPLTIHLGSLQGTRRSAMRFRYRWLSNAGSRATGKRQESAWVETRQPDLSIGTPGWGEHTIEVQSRLGPFGQWTSAGQFTFEVARPVWMSWPALSLGSVGILGGALLLRRRNRQKESEVLPDLSEWRVAALIPEAHELLGVVLDGRFRADRIVARGGFATVLAGVDLQNGSTCAIKVFRQELAGEWLRKRFEQEVAALESVDHPNVVRILGHGQTPDGTPYLAMEFVEGETLRQRVESHPAMHPGIAAGCVEQIGSALEAIHAKGIFHRDLKPDNIMLRRCSIARPGNLASQADEVVLIDFSIAIVRDPDRTMHGVSRAAGTILYMAPEQAVGFACEASDVYSMAKVVLEILTGKAIADLFPDASLDLPARVREYLQRDARLRAALSEESVAMLAQSLLFDPRARPQSALDLARPIVRDLRSIREDSWSEADGIG